MNCQLAIWDVMLSLPGCGSLVAGHYRERRSTSSMAVRKELLQFISTFGHDFLNHLQVISGLAQLNNPQRIREYISEVTVQVREVNKIANVPNEPIAAALLVFRQQTARYGIPLLFDIKANPTKFVASDEELEKVVGEVFDRFAGTLLPPLEGSGETLGITVVASEAKYIIRLEMPAELGESVDGLDGMIAGVDKLMRTIGGRSSLMIAGDDVRIFLTLPRWEE